jgi:low temperature requirement protein LtrA
MAANYNHSDLHQERRSVSTLELFFDLVFVFMLTQMTALLEEHLSFDTIIQVILVFVHPVLDAQWLRLADKPGATQ